MARLFQVTIAAEDYQPKSPMQVALLNPQMIAKMKDSTPGSAQTHILYKKHYGDTAIDILANAPVSTLEPLINAANVTNSVNVIQLTVRDDATGLSSTLDVEVKDIWKVIDDPAVSALSWVLLQNQPSIADISLHCVNTLAAIKALANA